MRTETLHRKTHTTNPKYATTLTTNHNPHALRSKAHHQPDKFRHKQRRPFIRFV
ncbi:hypothetical protein [Corynebacterium glaucum]|uniref:hypothetical protein n=1 Tax=Corynebacterium glaucum TaxID=187491 RepID=UPI0012FDBF3F|nr:hypothetical protein [Corynebacterium glaucum]